MESVPLVDSEVDGSSDVAELPSGLGELVIEEQAGSMREVGLVAMGLASNRRGRRWVYSGVAVAAALVLAALALIIQPMDLVASAGVNKDVRLDRTAEKTDATHDWLANWERDHARIKQTDTDALHGGDEADVVHGSRQVLQHCGASFCPTSDECCNDAICCSAGTKCKNKVCQVIPNCGFLACPADSICCRDICCGSDAKCCGKGLCCAPDADCCGNICCEHGTKCVNGVCFAIPNCGVLQCPKGDRCCNEALCCEKDAECCGSICCAHGDRCVDGVCVAHRLR